MMVAAAAQPGNMDVTKLLQKLSTTKDSKQKTAIYNELVEKVKDGSISNYVGKLATSCCLETCKDVLDNEVELSNAALQALGFFIHEPRIVKSLTKENGYVILTNLCSVLLRLEEKTGTVRALWCLSKQTLPDVIVANELNSILCSLEHVCSRCKYQVGVVDYETLGVVCRLLEQIPDDMGLHTPIWAKIIFHLVVHSVPKVRERALAVMEIAMPFLMKHQDELVRILIPDLKEGILGDMKKLFAAKQEVFVMRVWSCFVQVLGKSIHHGSFINSILGLAEQGFKSQSIEGKCAAFEAWISLIDNFATNPDILCDNKRVKLMMMVFKNNNAKVETLALLKLRVWWHFITKLDDKVSQLFDQTCAPLLHFAIGLGMSSNPATPSRKHPMPTGGIGTPKSLSNISANVSSPGTPRLNLSSFGSVVPTFHSVQLTGCEIISHFLGKTPDMDFPKFSYTLDSLSANVVSSPGFFAKHCATFMNAIKEAVLLLGDQIPAGLLYSIWFSLVAHCKNVLTVIGKKEGVDTLTSLLTGFQQIVQAEVLEPLKVLKLLEAISCLPPKALSSQSHNVGNAMHGTPALVLLELLLTQSVVEKCSIEERFFTLFDTLVDFGFMNQATVLDFSQSVLQMLEKVAGSIENKESVWRLWSIVSRPLTEHIIKTNEVNQGDSLEHNFSCMYSALMLPITQILPTELPQPTVKTLLKTWIELYKTFARLSALVTNADANICCEELSAKIIGAMNDVSVDNVVFLESLGQICLNITEAIDFSTFSTSNNFGIMSVSPAKWSKRKHKALGNLHSLVKVVEKLLEAIHEKKCKGLSPTEQKTWQLSVSQVIAVVDALFSQVTQSTMVVALMPHLSKPVGVLLEGSARKGANKLYSAAVCGKVEKLWQSIISSLQTRFSGPYDTDFLETVSPLLEAAFLHPKRNVKQTTTSLWNSTFANSAILKYPDSLKPVLMKVKEKTPIILPGWQTSEIMVIGETPVSQVSQAESQAPMPDLPGMSSPLRMRGSFLNKVVSPNVKNSPLKITEAQSPVQAIRKLKMSVNDLRDEDFVVIAPSPKKKIILTEHQKEVLKQRSAIPALYSNLDASQDVSLSAFTTTSQIDNSMDSSFSLLKKADVPIFKKPGGNEKVPERTVKEAADVRKRSVKFADEEESCQIIETVSNDDTLKAIGQKIDANSGPVSMETDEDDSVKVIENVEQTSSVCPKEEEAKIQDWELDMNGCFDTEMECDTDVTQEPSTAPPGGSAQSNIDSTSSFQFHASESTLVGTPRKITSSGETSNTSQVTLSGQSQSSLILEPKFGSQPFNSENPFNFDCETLEGASNQSSLDSCCELKKQTPRRRSSRRSSVQQQVEIEEKPEKQRKKGKQVFGVTVSSDVIHENSQSPKKVESFSVFGLKDGVMTPRTEGSSDRILGSQPLFSESPATPSPPRATSGNPPTMVLVEETQSPEKFKEKFLNVQDEHNDSIKETPLKDLESEVPKNGSPAVRALFDDADEDSLEKGDSETVKPSDLQATGGTPTSSAEDLKSIHVEMSPDGVVISSGEPKLNATPVVKLKKLTNAEIDHFSPRKPKDKLESEELKSESEKGIFPVSSQESSGQTSSQVARSSKRSKRRGSRSFRFSHGGQKDEMEDLAEMIESDDFVPSSQGFDLKSTESMPEFTAIKHSDDERLQQEGSDGITSATEAEKSEGMDEDLGNGCSNPMKNCKIETRNETTQNEEEIPKENETVPTSQSSDVSTSKMDSQEIILKHDTVTGTTADNAEEKKPKLRRGRPRKSLSSSQQSVDKANLGKGSEKQKNEKLETVLTLSAENEVIPEAVEKMSAEVEVIPETEVEASVREDSVAEGDVSEPVIKKGKKAKKGKMVRKQCAAVDVFPETQLTASELGVVLHSSKEGKKSKLLKKKKLYTKEKQEVYEVEADTPTKKKKKIANKVYNEDIFNRKCNLDVEEDSEEDLPLKSLIAKEKGSADSDEDLPLMSLVAKGVNQNDLEVANKGLVAESCDLFDNDSDRLSSAASEPMSSAPGEPMSSAAGEPMSSAASELEDLQASQTSSEPESTKRKKRGRGKSPLDRLTMDLVLSRKSTRSQKTSNRVTKLGRRNSLPSAKAVTKSEPKKKDLKTAELVEGSEDDVIEMSEKPEDESKPDLLDTEVEMVDVKVDQRLQEAVVESDGELEDICQSMADVRPEVRELISRPILKIPEFEKNDETEVTSSASPVQTDVLPGSDLQETPRSANKQSRFMLSRHRTSSPQFVRSRGLRLLELASQSATKPKMDRELDIANSSSTPKSKQKPVSSMTDPVRRHRLSRVDLILAKSKEITAKRETTEEPRTQAPSSPTNSVLPHGSAGSPESTESTVRATMSPSFSRSGFRTIQVNRIYSPSASPSAGILKKRKLSGDMATDSPSPPNKQRRVSFAESAELNTIHPIPSSGRSSPKPVNRCLELPKTSPLVTTDSRVSTTSDKFLTASSVSDNSCVISPSRCTDTFTAPRAVKRLKALPASPSPSLSPMSCQSTQESQLNCTGPFYPELTKCEEPVGNIVPKLTSSMWSRGLGKLMKARNITTIGNLCSLSEYEIHQLPIKTPKLVTMRSVLDEYKSKWELKKDVMMLGKVADMKVAEIEETEIAYDRVDSAEDPDVVASSMIELPSVEKELETLSPTKEVVYDCVESSEETVGSPLKELPSVEKELETLSPAKDIVTDEEEEMDTTIEMVMESSNEALQSWKKLVEVTLPGEENKAAGHDTVVISESVEFSEKSESNEDVTDVDQKAVVEEVVLNLDPGSESSESECVVLEKSEVKREDEVLGSRTVSVSELNCVVVEKVDSEMTGKTAVEFGGNEEPDNNNNLKKDKQTSLLTTEKDSAIELESPPIEESSNISICNLGDPVKEVEVQKEIEQNQMVEFKKFLKNGDKGVHLECFEIMTHDFTVDMLSQLPSNALFKLHQSLNDLTGKIGLALKSKCKSPDTR
ncbi:telomere-associated protein RIF1-like [Lineus longissimus]|uniref:telomere-associated protein RIF1-like n=1 Tax=Lineus longissimus TaxID=88925 RepID=UPI00315CF418